MQLLCKQHKSIQSWKQFSRYVRPNGCHLLKRLDEFPRSILITGCQRSGTTMLSRIITQSNGMVNYWFGKDDELAAALILSGCAPHQPIGRHCFQTTYLNECFTEYFDISQDHRIVWILRNPFSVVYSMIYNWRRWALDELFLACGNSLLCEEEKKRLKRYGSFAFSRIKKACFAYMGKLSQLEILIKNIGNMICVVDYDDLVKRKTILLPAIFDFVNIDYKNSYSEKIHTKSMDKQKRLSQKQGAIVKHLCGPTYEQARSLITIY